MMRRATWRAVFLTISVFALARLGYEARGSFETGAARELVARLAGMARSLPPSVLSGALILGLAAMLAGIAVLAARRRLPSLRLGVAARLARRGRSPARVARQTRLSQDAVRALARSAASGGRSSRSAGNPFRGTAPGIAVKAPPGTAIRSHIPLHTNKLKRTTSRAPQRYAPCFDPRSGRTVPSYEEEPCR